MAYRSKICAKCGNEFTPTSSTQSWCKSCLLKPCKNCGVLFHVRNKSKYETSEFCSVMCKRRYLSQVMVGENAANYKNGNRLTSEIICDNCGKLFKKDRTQIQKWDKHFCNRKCQIDFYKNPENKKVGENSPKYSQVDVICEWCGKAFKSYKSTASIVRFCSAKCRNDWQSDMMSGDKHFNWRGGTSGERQLDMARRAYREWRKSVFERDKYTCQVCGDAKGGNLRAHHIRRYSVFPELRYDIDNGITLCDKCHEKVHSQLDIQSEPQYNLLLKLRRLAEMTSPTGDSE